MVVRWTPEAASSLEQISLRIGEDSAEAALRTVRRIYESIEELVNFPYRCRVGREPGTRELVVPGSPYIAVYRVRESVVEVLEIWHGAQSRRWH
jgi:toxin ParE1/3/4